MNQLKPNTKRALNLILLLWINLGLSIVALASAIFQYIIVSRSQDGNLVDSNYAEMSDLAESIIAIVFFISFVISCVYFIMWFRRAYNNLHQLTSLTYSEGWAAGAWFVPILSLFRPYQIMKEMYNETDRILVQSNNIGNNLRKGYLGWWWALWVVSSILGQVLFRYSINMNSTSIEEVHAYSTINLIDSFVQVPLTFLAINVVKEYAFIEPELVSIQHKINEGEEENTGLFTESEYRRYLDHHD